MTVYFLIIHVVKKYLDMVTHIVGAVFGIVALVLCIIFSCLHHNGYGLASGIVYGVFMILLYTMSSIYHGLSPNLKAKKVFQIMDHCSIFVLIAGTYTPVLLCSVRQADPFWAWVLFGIVWAVTILGITLNAYDIEKFAKFFMACYLVLVWCIVFKFNLLPGNYRMNGIYLLVAGGVAYTIGQSSGYNKRSIICTVSGIYGSYLVVFYISYASSYIACNRLTPVFLLYLLKTCYNR